MTTTTMSSTTPHIASSGRPFTGRAFLLILVVGFGAVFAVNFTMAYLAIKSFNGVETESSYAAGRHFAEDMAAIEEQDARHWRVEAHVGPIDAAGRVAVRATFHDASGAPIKALTVAATLQHPTNEFLDRHASLIAHGDATFEGLIDGLKPGQRVLILSARGARGEALFSSHNRVVLNP